MELFLDGCKLMIFGVGWVFLFLIIMIFSVMLMSKAVRPFAAAFEPAPAEPKAAPKTAAANEDVELAAVAVVAVARELGK